MKNIFFYQFIKDQTPFIMPKGAMNLFLALNELK